MKNVLFKCRKCGYGLMIPEKTESVLCGNCATWNRPRSLFAALDQPGDDEKQEGSILQKVPGPIHSEVPGVLTGPEKSDKPGKDTNPPKPGLFSLITILFVAAPAISIIVKKQKLTTRTTPPNVPKPPQMLKLPPFLHNPTSLPIIQPPYKATPKIKTKQIKLIITSTSAYTSYTIETKQK